MSPRIRTVKPSLFWHDGLFDLESETGLPIRLSFIGLFTQADREGRFKWRPRQLKTQILPYDDVDFARVLDALATRAFVVKYATGGDEFGVIPGFKRHQVINNRESQSELPPPPENVEGIINRTMRERRVNDASTTREIRVNGASQHTFGNDIESSQTDCASESFDCIDTDVNDDSKDHGSETTCARVRHASSTREARVRHAAQGEGNGKEGKGKGRNRKDIGTRFVKPSVDEVRTYCAERSNAVDPQAFLDYYESNGWKVGKNPMKDWRAAVRTWEKSARPTNGARGTTTISTSPGEITIEDLTDGARLLTLFRRLADAGQLGRENTWASKLETFGFAERALEVGTRPKADGSPGNPVAFFVADLRDGRKDRITEAQDERARIRLREIERAERGPVRQIAKDLARRMPQPELALVQIDPESEAEGGELE